MYWEHALDFYKYMYECNAPKDVLWEAYILKSIGVEDTSITLK